MRTMVASVLVLVLTGTAYAIEDADSRLLVSREVAMTMQARLKDELLQALSNDGPVAAIGVCQTRAPLISRQVGDEAGVRVWRTGLRVRNPANVADAHARGVLEDFARRLAAGENADALESFQRGADGSARYMKAIMTQPLCETCHGTAMAAPVLSALAERYPADQATGFVAGDLRGAVVVDWLVAPRAVD